MVNVLTSGKINCIVFSQMSTVSTNIYVLLTKTT